MAETPESQLALLATDINRPVKESARYLRILKTLVLGDQLVDNYMASLAEYDPQLSNRERMEWAKGLATDVDDWIVRQSQSLSPEMKQEIIERLQQIKERIRSRRHQTGGHRTRGRKVAQHLRENAYYYY